MDGISTSTLDIELPGETSNDVESRIRKMLGNRIADSGTQLALAASLFDKGDDSEAVRVLRQLVYSDPTCLQAYDRLVDTYTRLNRPVEASEIYHAWGRVLARTSPVQQRTENPATDEASVAESVAHYYAIRAPEYDDTAGYMHAKSQDFVEHIKCEVRSTVQDRDAIEIACGTGFWTSVVADAARTLLATDRNIELVEIVRKKMAGASNVRCQVADAYSFEGVEGKFGAAYAQFWWSHIPRALIGKFVNALHAKLDDGARVYFMDSLPYQYAPRRLDPEGNVLEPRVLMNGDKYEVIKNFPTEAEIRAALESVADDVCYRVHEKWYVWTVSYKVRKA